MSDHAMESSQEREALSLATISSLATMSGAGGLASASVYVAEHITATFNTRALGCYCYGG